MDNLRHSYLARERNRKTELIVVVTLWLLGCPILCFLPQTNAGTIWNTPDELMCGLPQFSISSSMTGHYPKIWGSIFATLFAVLVVQRTSNGLCPALMLGWLTRFSPLVNANHPPSTTYDNNISRELYKRIQRIETFGYIAGACLVTLVVLDAKHFPVSHILLAQVAFFALYRQDWSVGTLGRDFPKVFPNWTSEHGRLFFYIGLGHFVVMMVSISILQTIYNTGHCEQFNDIVQSASMKLFLDADTVRWILSVAIWYTEYAFGLCCIYIQLLTHYEVQLWDFVSGGDNPAVPIYLEILPRFSVKEVFGRILFGNDQERRTHLDTLLGSCDDSQSKAQKAKMG